MKVRERVESLGMTFPSPPRPAFNYIPVVVHGDVAYISGQIPRQGETVLHPGKVGGEVSVKQAREAARLCVLYALAALEENIGELERVARVLKVTGFVNSAPGFVGQPGVLDAASDLLISLFGDRGRHARSAVGVAELPRNSPVEIEMVLALDSPKGGTCSNLGVPVAQGERQGQGGRASATPATDLSQVVVDAYAERVARRWQVARTLYSAGELSALPAGVVESALGLGNPVRDARLQPVEVVLDVGCSPGRSSWT